MNAPLTPSPVRPSIVGFRIRAALKHRGVTQAWLGQRISIDLPVLSNLVRHGTVPACESAEGIARDAAFVLGCSETWLRGESAEPGYLSRAA